MENKKIIQKFSLKNMEDIRHLSEFCIQLDGLRKIFLLSGPLGAGKTEFVKQWGALWGIMDVASPSFALHHSYESSFGSLEHWDLYRLEDVDQLESVGFWDQFQTPQGTLLIEWPERVPSDWWPKDWKVFWLDFQPRQSCEVYQRD